MSSPQPTASGLTTLGKLFSALLIIGLLALGGWIVVRNLTKFTLSPAKAADTQPQVDVGFDASGLSETKMETPKLGPAMAYEPKDGIVDIELSEYAGYAGLIAANGGLNPSDSSYFFTKHGFKLRIKLSEEESWNELNAGKMAASATTADVLAIYGRQFQVVVPAQIGFSRGADGLVVRNDIRRVNDLKGKVVVAAQFTESDFFIRYLATEAGLPINMMSDLKDTVNPDALNLVFSETGEAAGDLFVKALKSKPDALAGCVTWAPKTTEIPTDSGGKAKLLVSNKNLLLIADILIVNRGFADKYPKLVAGLVEGLLAGNKAVRDNPEANAEVIGKAFKWDHAQTLAELQKVHLSNLPEQRAFFNAGINQGGSFSSIYQSAVLAYGTTLIPNPVDSDHFLSLDALEAVEKSGLYKDQIAAILPLSSGNAPAETDPVLSQDIRFFFEPNKSNLDMTNKDNQKNLDAIKRILDVSPGSRIILVGHVDDARIAELRKTGGEELVQKVALDAVQLSKERANEIKNQLVSRETADPKRLETVGRGWMQPVSSTNPELNRRVEVQWFTLE